MLIRAVLGVCILLGGCYDFGNLHVGSTDGPADAFVGSLDAASDRGDAGSDCAGGTCDSAFCCSIAAGYSHTCTIKADGTLWCWGSNGTGQLGINTTAEQHVPVQVTALGTAAAQVGAAGSRMLAAGAMPGNTCARKQDGTLWCWGQNSSGALGMGTTTDQYSPVQVTALGNSVVDVAVANQHSCARKGDGTLWCWGGNGFGQLGIGNNSDQYSPVQVAALGTSSVSTSTCCGYSNALKQDGTFWSWGYNLSGQLGIGNTNNQNLPVQVTGLGTTVAAGTSGGSHACARKQDGTLWCWGANGNGQLGIGDTSNHTSPVQVSFLGTTVAVVAAGGNHTCAVKQDGTLWCWGLNSNGQLGNNTTTNQLLPAQVTTLGNTVVQVTAGYAHTCARKQDGSVWCWGWNGNGQLGLNDTIDRALPVQVCLGCP